MVTLPFGVEEVVYLGERANAHWIARRGDEDLVVRRFRPIRARAYAEYEAVLCNRLSEMGHPVPRVLDIAEFHGATWMLMTRVRGEPGTYADDDPRRRGRQLAELHGSMALLVDLGQRDGRMFADEVVASPTLDDALAYYATVMPDDAHVMQWHVSRTRERFAEHDTAALPMSIIHGDFAPWNLLFSDGELTGIVDFDLAHLAHRISDFALSWRGKYDDVVHGYNDVLPLADDEWALLSPVRWAWIMWFVEDEIAAMRDGRVEPHSMEWVVQQLLRRSPLMGPDAAPY